MKNIEKYRDPEISKEEMDDLTGKLLRAKLNRDKKQKWADILEKEYNVRRDPGNLKVVSRRSGKTWLLIAASLLLPILVYLWLWKPAELSAQQLAQAYLSEEKILEPQTRKGEITIEALSQKATEAYNQGKFQESISLWEQMEAKGGMGPDDYFFKGVSHLRLNQEEKAIDLFRQIRSMGDENPKFQKETTWMLALAYIKTGRNDEADEALRQVVRDGWRAEKAQKLLDILDSGK